METYYQKNKEKIKVYVKKWALEHPDKIKEYKERHAPKQKVYYEKWYKQNGRNRTEHDKEKIFEYHQEHPDRIKIHIQLFYAVKKGYIEKPEICPRCGKKSRLHAHHINYNHFMNFIWLCASCHKKEHNNNFS